VFGGYLELILAEYADGDAAQTVTTKDLSQTSTHKKGQTIQTSKDFRKKREC
jgi:hypothetical protein